MNALGLPDIRPRCWPSMRRGWTPPTVRSPSRLERDGPATVDEDGNCTCAR